MTTLPKQKTFEVVIRNGSQIESRPAWQLATFTHYILGVQYRFVVTKLGTEPETVTHRLSGMRFAPISFQNRLDAKGDIRTAGKLAVAEKIKTMGALFVKARLDETEAGHLAPTRTDPPVT